MKTVKAITPYELSSDRLYAWCGKAATAKTDKLLSAIENFIVRDPLAHEWDSMGLTEPMEEGRFVHDLDGTARLMMYKFNQRILPAVVRDKEVQARLDDMQRRMDREVTKQEYAQVKEEVEAALLPKAFIRPSYVPVLVYKDMVFFGTSSARRVDQMMVHLLRLMDTRDLKTEIRPFETKNSMGWFINALVKDEVLECEDGENFCVGDAAVFKGGDKRSVRFKDRAITSYEVQKVAEDEGYTAVEVQAELLTEDGDDLVNFTVNDKWIVKSIKLNEKDQADNLVDMHATYWFYARILYLLMQRMLEVLNDGSAEDEDEEL